MSARLIALGCVLVCARLAHAQAVVVMAGPEYAGELDAALRVVLAARGTAVASVPAPAGQLRLERAASAQRAAARSGADAAVWIDDAEICAVTVDGHDFRHAPFPADTASPRAFAAIAASLLDEMIAPAPWAAGMNINVNVDITPPGDFGTPAVIAGVPPALRRRDRTLIELGAMASPIGAGVEGGVAIPLTSQWRIAGMVSLGGSYDANSIIPAVGAEVRHVGAGKSRHWDVGPAAGFAAPDKLASIAFAGVRIARTWELARSALSVGVTPLIAAVLREKPEFVPGAWVSLRWQFAL